MDVFKQHLRHPISLDSTKLSKKIPKIFAPGHCRIEQSIGAFLTFVMIAISRSHLHFLLCVSISGLSFFRSAKPIKPKNDPFRFCCIQNGPIHPNTFWEGVLGMFFGVQTPSQEVFGCLGWSPVTISMGFRTETATRRPLFLKGAGKFFRKKQKKLGQHNWLVVEPTPLTNKKSKWVHLPQFSGWK